MITVKSSGSILDENLVVFDMIFEIISDLIISQRVGWKEALVTIYAMGKKSFNCLEFMLNQETSLFSELVKAMVYYNEEEKKQMDKVYNKN